MRWLLDRLADPSLRGMNVDSTDRLSMHGAMLQRKRMLREVFTEFHHLFERLDRRFLSGTGLRIELGAGVAPMRESYPDVISTDVVAGPHLDRVLDALAMDLPDHSVRVFFGQNCFHHFPDPDRFFDELQRVLTPGGGAVILEPYYGPFAGMLFKRLFRTEGFDKSAPGWQTDASGPMNGANQALSYLVFVRDREAFLRRHPGLEIVHHEVLPNYLKYLLSGGLNFRQLLPDGATGLVEFAQRCLSPMNRWLSLHHVVVIRKRVAA
ncbi:class I SAM-dependent methyltransferase [Rhodoferax koreensis]|nr:methyltransferase domain-containing protein [Rhodoferax koreense]